jgi:hypothetical protein
MASPLAILVRDAADTLGRMRADARHLRELSVRAKVGAKMAGAQLRAKIDRALEGVADGILEAEDAYKRFKRPL